MIDKHIFLSIFLVLCCAATTGIYIVLENAEATGCPTNFVAEHVDNALKAYNEGDAKEVKNQLDLAKEAVAQFEEEE